MIYMASRNVLNVFKNLAEARPKDKKIAERICKAVKVGFNEDKFVEMYIIEREASIDGDIVYSIIISFTDHEIEVTILDYSYFVTNLYRKHNYQIVKEYYYEEDVPALESFSISNGTCTMSIKEEYPASSVMVANDDICLTRTHLENNYFDPEDNLATSILNFVNEISTDQYNGCDEVFYFQDNKSMYHIRNAEKKDEYSFQAGATLDNPRYKLTTIDFEEEEKALFKNTGIAYESTDKYPKIYCLCSYNQDNYDGKVEMHIIKYNTFLSFAILENNKDKITFNVSGELCSYINKNDLNKIKEELTKRLGDRPYIDLVTNYIDELILRSNKRLKTNFDNMVSYNEDIFDFYINGGKDIFSSKGKDIEHRAFDIYCRKETLGSLLKGIKEPEIGIKKSSVQLKKIINHEQ